ncbi:Hypothetical protein, putative, partial [Bodo saltans]
MIDSDSSAISTGSHDCHNAHCCVHNSPSSGTSSFCGSASRLRPAASSPATTAWVHFVVGGIGTGKTSWIACATTSLLEEHVDEFVSVHTVVEQYHNATSRRSTTQGKDIDSSSHTAQQLQRIIHGWADKDVATGSVVIPETNTLTNTSGHSDATLQVSASAADVASIVSSLVFPKDILVGHATSRSPLDDVDQHARLLNKHVFVECAGESLLPLMLPASFLHLCSLKTSSSVTRRLDRLWMTSTSTLVFLVNTSSLSVQESHWTRSR